MYAEIAIPFHGDLIAAELDIEKEQEENKEKEKEKTTEILDDVKFLDLSISSFQNTSSHKDSFWVSPSLDFSTPPPELI